LHLNAIQGPLLARAEQGNVPACVGDRKNKLDDDSPDKPKASKEHAKKKNDHGKDVVQSAGETFVVSEDDLFHFGYFFLLH
jgi:hypothetical protein